VIEKEKAIIDRKVLIKIAGILGKDSLKLLANLALSLD